MHILDKWLPRIDTVDGITLFHTLYSVSPWQDIVDRQLKIMHFNGVEIFKHLVFMNYKGKINQTFILEEDDSLVVYSEGNQDSIFSTKERAYLRLLKEEAYETKAMWCIEDSPLQVPFEQWDKFYSITCEEAFIKLNKILSQHKMGEDATIHNTIFVIQN